MGFQIQGGGTDLIFPHHEMSAVQATSLTGRRPFAEAYVHQAMVGLEGEKMSKSQGNLVLVSRLRETGVDPMAIRLALLARHYRTAWDWTEEILRDAVTRLGRWRAAGALTRPDVSPSSLDEETVAQVRTRLSDDLDAPGALAGVDHWAERALGRGEPVAPLVPRAVDALLGVPTAPA
jgi:L-cysteine:1D-myo-inositol 2-amino-2-deoxy-alpha-D-glucopyranoside ligase